MLRGGTFWSMVERRADLTPDAPMIIDDGDRVMTFAQYREAAERAAAGLAERGVGPGTPVSWQLPTWPSTLVLQAALARLGAVQNPIIPVYREREVGFCLCQTGARLFLVPSVWRGFDFQAMARTLAADIDGLEVVVCDVDLPAADVAAPADVAPPDDPEAIRWVYYTSGTTSDPKGARHCDTSAMASGIAMVERQQFTPDDRFGLAFPFAHIGGVCNLSASLSSGCTLVIAEAFDPAATTALFARHGVTVVGGGPAFFMAFLAEQRKQPGEPILPELRLCSGGGAPMPASQHYEVRAEMGGRGCGHAWGMTEAPIIAQNAPDDADEKLAETEGRPLAGAEIKVVGFDGSPAGVGVEGELWIRGPMVCRGYTDEALTAACFDDGWFHTGDVGFLDADGYVTLTGRVKDIIIRKGENISATEIEDLLHAHPKVADVGVIGLPDEERGERVCAVVEPAPGVEAMTLDEVRDYFRSSGVMAQKIPEQLEMVDSLPRNATGKVLKHELRDLFAD
ncbi:class I adenylate-forming enzyme family protein [Candidatus Poriferisocius sp.]|uniref:class I adenylate-forming enzyme family protein n=1 Tax=Candidatus Poriferisocius sp. TaxID=3101276 RepID=UPI003B5C181D